MDKAEGRDPVYNITRATIINNPTEMITQHVIKYDRHNPKFLLSVWAKIINPAVLP